MQLHKAAALLAMATLGVEMLPRGGDSKEPLSCAKRRRVRQSVEHVTSKRPLSKRQKRRQRGKGESHG